MSMHTPTRESGYTQICVSQKWGFWGEAGFRMRKVKRLCGLANYPHNGAKMGRRWGDVGRNGANSPKQGEIPWQ